MALNIKPQNAEPPFKENDNERIAIGNNSGALAIDWSELLDPDTIRLALAGEYEKLIEARAKMLKMFEAFKKAHAAEVVPLGFKLLNDADITTATDIGKQIKEHAKKVEAIRKLAKAPFDAAVDAVQKFFRNIGEPMEKSVKDLEAAISVINADRAREAQRLAREEADRKREDEQRLTAAAVSTMNPDLIDQAQIVAKEADQAEKVASGPVANFSRARGNFGVSSGSIKYAYKITDINLVPREHMMIDDSKVRRLINGNDRLTEIPGLEIVEEFKTQIR